MAGGDWMASDCPPLKNVVLVICPEPSQSPPGPKPTSWVPKLSTIGVCLSAMGLSSILSKKAAAESCEITSSVLGPVVVIMKNGSVDGGDTKIG